MTTKNDKKERTLMNRHKNSIIYHGKNKKHSFFEGWYFKQVSEDEETSICFIPGVSINKEDSHAFIQCIYLNRDRELLTYNVKYPLSQFRTTNSPFEVWIGNSYFSKEEIQIDIESAEVKIKGKVEFEGVTPIQTTGINPNIMGIFSYMPKMECNHGIISMNHNLIGAIDINNQKMALDKGKGYIEKDWGSSFPKEYMWMQSNHFEDSSVSLFCSVANIPFMGRSFQGFICNLIVQGKEYRFATYNGSKLNILGMNDHGVELVLSHKGMELYLLGQVVKSEELLAPKDGRMNNVIKEGLSGTVKVVLKKETGEILLDASGTSCGLELVKALRTI